MRTGSGYHWIGRIRCKAQLFCTCKTQFIFGEKCAHFSALYYVNALYDFLGFSFLCVLKLNLQ